MTALRTIAQALAVPLALIVAVTVQLALVNRVPLPGHTAPDLVLLVVAAVAASTGPMSGMLAGFAGGLALDVAPPASHLAGEYALVFCLAGYFVGRARNAIIYATGGLTMLTGLTLVALGTAAGEAGKAALGRLLSDQEVTTAAIRHVLPGAIIYDLLLSPFVYWLVSLALRRPAPERAPRPEFTQVASAFRIASAGGLGAVPKLRLARSIPPQARAPSRAEPKLRLSSGRSSPLSGTYSAFSPAQTARPGGRPVRLNFSNGNSAANAAPASRRTSPGKGWLRAGQPAGVPAPRRTSPGKGWLRTARPAGAPVMRRTSPGKGWLRTARPAGTPAIRKTSPGKGWLRAARPAGIRAAAVPAGRSPGKGWLTPPKPAPAPQRKSPGKGWLRPAKPVRPRRRKSPGRRWLRPAKPARQNWYGRPPSTRWVRRSHSPWRGRRQRLLALMGGRR